MTSPPRDHALERVKSYVNVSGRELLQLIHLDYIIFCKTHEPPWPTFLIIQGYPVIISESVDTHALELRVGIETFDDKLFLQIIHKLLRSDTLLQSFWPRRLIGISAFSITKFPMSVRFLDHILGCASLLHYVNQLGSLKSCLMEQLIRPIELPNENVRSKLHAREGHS